MAAGGEYLKRSGKVRFFGISVAEHDPESAMGAVRTEIIDAVQVIYNIFDQTPENFFLTLPREKGGCTGASALR